MKYKYMANSIHKNHLINGLIGNGMNKTKIQNKERPTIFNSEMVKSILDGRKTQTRRVIKPQPGIAPGIGPVWKGSDWDEEWIKACPHGQIGDRLWVRETYCFDEYDDGHPVVFYRATDHETCGQPWRPSIHMPRWASRITLEITDIRVERLQDISEDDARAEGSNYIRCGYRGQIVGLDGSYREGFVKLWDSINAKRKTMSGDMGTWPADFTPYTWENNPWVWVLEFKRIENE